MVVDYIITIIFYLLFGFFYYILGLSLSRKYKFQETTMVLIGFFVHTSILAIVGILFQIMGIEWKLFFYLSLLWLIVCVLFSLYCIKKYNIKLFEKGILEFIKKYWFL